MFRCAGLTLILALLFPAAARADWDAASHVPLKRVHATGQVRLLEEACPVAALACTETSKRPLTIYLPVRLRNRRQVYYHEIAHAFDVLLLTDADRYRLQRLMGNTDLSWDLDDIGHPDAGAWVTAHEQFADAFMMCALLGPRSRSARIQVLSDYDWVPSVRRQQRVCREIIRLAR